MSEDLLILGELIAEQAAHMDAAEHRLLTNIRDFDARHGWVSAQSCAHWLAWRVGWTLGTAREHVRVAKALGSLPHIDEALRLGKVSYCKVRAMTRVATPQNEELLLLDATLTTGSQLERICRKYRQIQRLADNPSPADDDIDRYVTRRDLDNGMVKIEAVLHPEEAALFWSVLEQATKELYAAGATSATSSNADGAAATNAWHAFTAASSDKRASSNAQASSNADASSSGDASSNADVALHADARSNTDVSSHADASSIAYSSSNADDRSTADDTYADTISHRDTTSALDTNDCDDDAHDDDEPNYTYPWGHLDLSEEHPSVLAGSEFAKPACRRSDAPTRAGERVAAPAHTAGRSARGAERSEPGTASMDAERVEHAVEVTRRRFDRADGLMAMIRRFSMGDLLRSPVEIVVTIPAVALQDNAVPVDEQVAFLHDGSCITAATAQRLSCDAGVVYMSEDERGQPLTVGRRTRTIPSVVQRALSQRDPCCRFPGCTNRVYLDSHHIEHWANGGATTLVNMVRLCTRHHKFVHEYGYRIELDEHGQPQFFDPRGRPAKDVPPRIERADLGWQHIVDANEGLGIVPHKCKWDGLPVPYSEVCHGLYLLDEGNRDRG